MEDHITQNYYESTGKGEELKLNDMINEMVLDNIMLRKLLYQANEKLINFLA
jgi:hypothetical protein